MFELTRDVGVAPQPCLRCGSARTIAGRVNAESEVRFLPRGLRWWKFSAGAPLLPDSVQACLDCGCVVGGVDAAELRATVERAGGDEARAVLDRPRPPRR